MNKNVQLGVSCSISLAHFELCSRKDSKDALLQRRKQVSVFTKAACMKNSVLIVSLEEKLFAKI